MIEFCDKSQELLQELQAAKHQKYIKELFFYKAFYNNSQKGYRQDLCLSIISIVFDNTVSYDKIKAINSYITTKYKDQIHEIKYPKNRSMEIYVYVKK
jgi:hypothetical protein